MHLRTLSESVGEDVFFNAGVPPDRQKVMFSGATILDEDWGKAKGKIKEVLEEQQILHELVDVEWSSPPECHVTDDGFGRGASPSTFREAKVY